MAIDLEELGSELQRSGTDERLTRALLVLGRHVNEAFDRIEREAEATRRREAYYEMMKGA